MRQSILGRYIAHLAAVAVIGCLLTCVIAEAPSPTSPEAKSEFIRAKAPGWPQWRGPRRDGISNETGLLTSWPVGGPKLLWAADGLGTGWSSPVISGDSLYVTGDVGDELHVFAITSDGKRKWRATNGESFKKPYGGARGSCCYDDGRVFNLNGNGRLACFDAKDGKELWAVDVLKKFEASRPYFGYAECVMVDGDGVIVTPGGKKGLMVRLDKKTGRTIWAARGQGDEGANYSSPVLVNFAGKRQILAGGSKHTFAVDADKGKVLWAFRHSITKSMSTSITVMKDDLLYITNSCREYGLSYCLQIDPAGRKARKVWDSKADVSHGSVVSVGGKIYGASRRKLPGWVCVDFKSGRTSYVARDMTRGSNIYAEGRLYCLLQKGTMLLLKPTGKSFEKVGQFEFVPAAKKKDAWAHPVICNGRLYLRYHDKLYCYDIRK